MKEGLELSGKMSATLTISDPGLRWEVRGAGTIDVA
jgi:hypothetical protein